MPIYKLNAINLQSFLPEKFIFQTYSKNEGGNLAWKKNFAQDTQLTLQNCLGGGSERSENDVRKCFDLCVSVRSDHLAKETLCNKITLTIL